MSIPGDGRNNPPPQLDTNIPAQGGGPEALSSNFWSTIPMGENWGTGALQAGNFGPSDAVMNQFPGDPFNTSDSDDEVTNAFASSISKYLDNNPNAPISAGELARSGINLPGATQDLLYRKDSLSFGNPSDELPTPMKDGDKSPVGPAVDTRQQPGGPARPGSARDNPPGRPGGSSAGEDPLPPKPGEGREPPGRTEGTDKINLKVDFTDKSKANLVFKEDGTVDQRQIDTNNDGKADAVSDFQKIPEKVNNEVVCNIYAPPGTDVDKAWNSFKELQSKYGEKANFNITENDFKERLKSAMASEQPGSSGGGQPGGSGAGGDGSCGPQGCGGSGGSGGGSGGAGGGDSGGGGAGGSGGAGGGDSGGGAAGGSGGEQPRGASGETTGGSDSGDGSTAGGRRVAENLNLSHGMAEVARRSVTSPESPMNPRTMGMFAQNWYSGMQRAWSKWAAKDTNGDGKIDDKDENLTAEEIAEANKEIDAEAAKLDAKVKEMSAQSPEAEGSLREFANRIKDHSKGNEDFHKAMGSLIGKTNNPQAQMSQDDLKGIFPDGAKEGQAVPNPIKAAVAGRILDGLANSTLRDDARIPQDEKTKLEAVLGGAKSLLDVSDLSKLNENTVNNILKFLHERPLNQFNFAADRPAQPASR